jgi:type II secretory pathway predicted ATPase ExeA
MYEEFYGLTDEPFNITPNPRFLYLSKKHEGGLEHLLYGIERKRGLIVLTGDVGTGKTTLLNTIVQRIGAKTHIAFLVQSKMSAIDIYKYIFYEFDLKTDINGKTEGDFLVILRDFLVECAKNGENCVLIIDEAHSLSQDVLEQIRLFLNFETYDRKLLQIILAGHPELHEKLNLPESAKLKQRVSISYNLLPLDDTETKGYIEKRLTVSGARKPIYSDDAIAEVYRCSQGIPRLINIVCDLALFLGYGKKQLVLDRDMILQAEQMLHMKEAQVPGVLSLEHAREQEVQAPRLHPSAVNEPIQDILAPRGGRTYLDVLSNVQRRLGRVDSPPSSQAPASGRSFWWPLLGGIAASLALSLIFWGGFLHEPASLKHGADKLVQSVQQLFTASPSAPQSAARLSTGTEHISFQPPDPISPSQATASMQTASSLPVAPQESHTEPTSTEDSLSPQKPGRVASTLAISMPGAASAPSDAVSSPVPPSTPRVIVVQAGDTLGEIIRRTYKRLDRRLLTLVQGANPNLTNPSHIEIGQYIVLPNLP